MAEVFFCSLRFLGSKAGKKRKVPLSKRYKHVPSKYSQSSRYKASYKPILGNCDIYFYLDEIFIHLAVVFDVLHQWFLKMQVIRVAWKHFTFQFPNCVVKFDLQLKKSRLLGISFHI